MRLGADAESVCVELDAPTAVAGAELKSGEMLVGDPRGVYREASTGRILYHPRQHPHAGWVSKWLNEHPEWAPIAPEPRRHDDRPWMTALEMQLSALRMARRAVSAWAGNADKDLAYQSDYEAARLLPTCQPFAWQDDTVKAVWLASKSIPADSYFSPTLLPDGLQACWWWLGWPLPIKLKDRAFTEDEGFDADHITAVLVAYGPNNTLLCVDFRMWKPHGPAATSFFVIPRGTSLAEMAGGRAITTVDGQTAQPTPRALAMGRFILAGCAWLQQRIASCGSGHIERHRRKQIAREYDVPMPSDVKVIQLRRTEPSAQQSRSDNSHPVDWSCRWIVNGHWRNQPYANGERKLIYIMPFVKGPDNKPLRVPSHTVYQVSR